MTQNNTTRDVETYIFLAGNDLLGVVKLTVRSRPDLITDTGFQIHIHSTGDVTAFPSLGKEGGAGIITGFLTTHTSHLAGGVNAVLEAVQFPALVARLDAGLAEVDADALAHGCCCWLLVGVRRWWILTTSNNL